MTLCAILFSGLHWSRPWTSCSHIHLCHKAANFDTNI